MGVQFVGTDGATIAEVDAGHSALRVTARPTRVNSWQSFGVATGTVTGVAAGGPLFSFRYTGTSVMLVRRVQLQWVTTAAYLTAQRMEFGCYVARSWTVADSGGLPLTIASGKHRTGMPTPAFDARVGLTGAVTAGTRTLDAHPIGLAALWVGGLGATLTLTSLLSNDPGDHPLAIGNQEGFVVSNMLAMGTSGAGLLYVNIEFAEAPSY